MQGSPPSYNQAVAVTAHQPHHVDTSLPVNVTAGDKMASPTLSDIKILSFGMSADHLGLFFYNDSDFTEHPPLTRALSQLIRIPQIPQIPGPTQTVPISQLENATAPV